MVSGHLLRRYMLRMLCGMLVLCTKLDVLLRMQLHEATLLR